MGKNPFPRCGKKKSYNMKTEQYSSIEGSIPEIQAKILTAQHIPISSQTRLLDIGCGNGNTVQGWLNIGVAAYGCDLRFKDGSRVDILKQQNRLQLINDTPYHLPYPTCSAFSAFTKL